MIFDSEAYRFIEFWHRNAVEEFRDAQQAYFASRSDRDHEDMISALAEVRRFRAAREQLLRG
jgi:hypothetical protein